MGFKVCIIYIVLLILYLIYYFNVVVEQPNVYYSEKMKNVYTDIPSINKNVYWTLGCHNNLIQYFIYKIESKIGSTYINTKDMNAEFELIKYILREELIK